MADTANSCSPPEQAAQNSAERMPLPEAETEGSAFPKWREVRKVLILDDEPEILNLYKKMIDRLPSRPKVEAVDSAKRALSLLDEEPFELFITDLRMPQIDGFQVLLSARQRWPDLKTIVMTGARNEQYRARAYESGIDLFIQKPTTPEEIRLFGECVEALLQKGEKDRGFRGIQSKSLMDLVQIECLSRNSITLRITSGSLVGSVWIANGHVIDAETQGLRGEEAFRFMFGWKSGNFESMPGNPDRKQTIFTSYESLLLESAHTLDTAAAGVDQEAQARDREFKLLATVRGVQSLLVLRADGVACDMWGFENTEGFVAWMRRVLRDFHGVGEILKAGPVTAIQAAGRERGLVVLSHGRRQLLAGMDRKMSIKFLRKAGLELAHFFGKDLQMPVIDLASEPARYACGSYTVSAGGKVNVSALPLSFPRVVMEIIGKVFISAFASARELDNPLTELAADFAGVEVRARDAEGGAIVFITPQES